MKIYILTRKRVDFEDNPLCDLEFLHAFTSIEKLEQYKIEQKIIDEPFKDNIRNVYGIKEIDLD